MSMDQNEIDRIGAALAASAGVDAKEYARQSRLPPSEAVRDINVKTEDGSSFIGTEFKDGGEAYKLLTEGVKFDDNKLRLDLLPVDAIEEIAVVLTYGAKKYADRNWERGMRWSRLYGAALRHLFSWWKGEEADPETGLSHLAHAACCVIFLLSYQLRNGRIHSEVQKQTEFDDRP